MLVLIIIFQRHWNIHWNMPVPAPLASHPDPQWDEPAVLRIPHRQEQRTKAPRGCSYLRRRWPGCQGPRYPKHSNHSSARSIHTPQKPWVPSQRCAHHPETDLRGRTWVTVSGLCLYVRSLPLLAPDIHISAQSFRSQAAAGLRKWPWTDTPYSLRDTQSLDHLQTDQVQFHCSHTIPDFAPKSRQPPP